jgi:hypothetical protein
MPFSVLSCATQSTEFRLGRWAAQTPESVSPDATVYWPLDAPGVVPAGVPVVAGRGVPVVAAGGVPVVAAPGVVAAP